MLPKLLSYNYYATNKLILLLGVLNQSNNGQYIFRLLEVNLIQVFVSLVPTADSEMLLEQLMRLQSGLDDLDLLLMKQITDMLPSDIATAEHLVQRHVASRL